MTGDDVKRIRRDLGVAAGRRISQRELGAALGLSADNADRMVRRWEDAAPTGPAAVALGYLHQAALDDVMRQAIPAYVQATALPEADGTPELVLRLHWPRFIAAVMPADDDVPDGLPWAWIEPGVERLAIAMWIDDPAAFGADPDALLREAATLFQESTLDALDAEG